MDETIISINAPNIFSVAIMIIVIFAVAGFVMTATGKMKGGEDG